MHTCTRGPYMSLELSHTCLHLPGSEVHRRERSRHLFWIFACVFPNMSPPRSSFNMRQNCNRAMISLAIAGVFADPECFHRCLQIIQLTNWTPVDVTTHTTPCAREIKDGLSLYAAACLFPQAPSADLDRWHGQTEFMHHAVSRQQARAR